MAQGPVRSNKAPAPTASSSFFAGFDDERLLEVMCDMIEKNRRKEFFQLKNEIDKRRLCRLLTRPIKRTGVGHTEGTIRLAAIIEGVKDDDDDAATVVSSIHNGGYDEEQEEEEVDFWWTPLHLMAKQNRTDMLSTASEAVEELFARLSGTENWPDVFGQTPLHVACIKGHVAVCRMLCRQAAALMAGKSKVQPTSHDSILNLINTPDRIGCSPLHYAVMLQSKNQGEELSKILLSNGCDPNIPDNDGFTPLSLTAHLNNLELTCLLLAYGASPNHQSVEDGWTPLMIAAFNGYVKVASTMLNPQMQAVASDVATRNASNNLTTPIAANPALQSKMGATALIVAAQNCQTEMVTEMLTTSKAVINTINIRDVSGRTALAAATIKGHIDVVIALLDKRADVNIADQEGATPLMLAIANGHRPIVDLLLQRGADVTVRDENGCTALMVAASAASPEITRALLSSASKAGVSISNLVNAQQKDGTTALMIAVTKGNDRVVELLVSAHATMDQSRAVDDWTALFHAVQFEKNKIVRSLLNRQQGAVSGASSPALLSNRLITEVNRSSDNDKMTPLLLAALNGNAHIARSLLEAGANPNHCDDSKFTPLMAAAQNSDEKVMQLLLMKGAKPDAQEKNGYSALMISAMNGAVKMCDMLLAQGASPDLSQVNGRTAMMLAAEKGVADVVKIILKRGGSPAVTDVFNRTALHYGVIGANEKVMTVLCDFHEINPNVQDRNGCTPLMLAASSPVKPKPPEQQQQQQQQQTNDADNKPKPAPQPAAAGHGPPPEVLHVIPLLRLKATSLDLRDGFGDTALMRAFRAHNWSCAEALLRSGASAVKPALSDGMPPFVFAAANGLLPGIKLIKHLAHRTINVTDTYGRTALFHAVVNEEVEAVSLLISDPAPVDMKLAPSRSKVRKSQTQKDPQSPATPNVDKLWFFGMSPLHVAAKKGNVAIATILVEAGCSLNHLNDKRETPLMHAASGGHWPIVEMLLANGASVASRDSAGQTVLHRLCYMGDEAETSRGLRLIVKHRGVHVLDTAVDSPAGNTVLHWAVVCDQPEVVNELVILGASRDVKNGEGKTPQETVIYAPLLFESVGEVIGEQWRNVANQLRKKAAPTSQPQSRQSTPRGSKSPRQSTQPFFTEEDLADIENYFMKDDASFEGKCAATMIEQFYERCDESSNLDTGMLAEAWRKAAGDTEIPQALQIIFEHCKDRTLIFRSNTLENLTKFRSKSAAGNIY